MGIFYTLKPEQVQTLQDLWNGIDTVAILPTGFGKSIIYQLLPYLIQKKTGAAEPMIAIVVAPLNSIMEDQIQSLRSKNLKGCYLSYDAKEIVTFDDNEVTLRNTGQTKKLKVCVLVA
ncbi:hypothetical protein DPMN_125124 [Dreissena polymorpha]|uniref:DNA 3'-5' helicase n=1 Tax=Dreissena polymorpha TaxID=45954 RepID=A0A9D4JT75_DREPO|nr:hypothetical protein DPMN_125124 [Dreissena polymorpha]